MKILYLYRQNTIPIISISADIWTVQLRFPDELQAFTGEFLCVKGNNSKPPTL